MDIFARRITSLPGVGKVREAAFAKIGIFTAGDLLYHFPRGYQDRKNVKSLFEAGRLGENCAMVLTVGSQPTSARLPGNKTVTSFTAFDDTGKITVSFFNQNYIRDVFKIGTAYRFFGKLTERRGKYFLSSPEFEPYSEKYKLPDYYPVYPLTDGITQKYLINLIGIVLSEKEELDDPIPLSVRKEYGLTSLTEAMKAIHRPADYDELDRARKRFVFEELYVYTAGMRLSRKKTESDTSVKMSRVDIAPFVKCLPFELTGGQKNAINEIYHDMIRSGKRMTRLLSGDVGSGKTVCAEAAVYFALSNGYQACIMAPTEILANQHFAEMKPLFEKLGYSCALLTGSLTVKQKREIKEKIKKQEYGLVVGTHALLTEDTVFPNLGLVITDEQHRFGVNQRATLVSKAKGVHSLVMTATPIPRTLALILYGDLSISSITEMPKGRQEITTYIVGEDRRGGMYEFIKKELDQGRQCYMVCPAIEPNTQAEEDEGGIIDFWYQPLKEKDETPVIRNATEYYGDLGATVFKDYRMGLIHGKMKPKEKDEVMSRFVRGEIDILVSTTVIEVGVNVPNSTVMVIENAERYGLAQLHQLRGRVGRGSYRSYCMLMTGVKPESPAYKRLNVLKNSRNGYEIAEYDLSVRGPGDFIGSGDGRMRQHGEAGLKLASLCDDIELLSKATCAAENVLEMDGELSSEENKTTRKAISRLFSMADNTLN